MAIEWIGDAWGWFTTGRLQTISAVSAASVGIATLQRARRSSKSQARPMVGAELRIVPYTSGTLELVVKNYSDVVARNVRVSFDPELGVHPERAEQDQRVFISNRYAAQIDTMMPGFELSNTYSIKDETLDTDPPERVTVTITSESADTNFFGQRDKYTDSFVLDRTLFENHTYSTSSSSPHGQMNKLIKAVEGVKAALRK